MGRLGAGELGRPWDAGQVSRRYQACAWRWRGEEGPAVAGGERKRVAMGVAWCKRLRSRSAVAAAATAAGLVLASCSPAAPPAGEGGASRSGGVISLNQITALKSLFNRGNGHPRLVLIFS